MLLPGAMYCAERENSSMLFRSKRIALSRRSTLGLYLLVALVATSQFATATDRPFDFRETTLENGLRVVTLEDFSCPIVAVQVWYHVGSKDPLLCGQENLDRGGALEFGADHGDPVRLHLRMDIQSHGCHGHASDTGLPVGQPIRRYRGFSAKIRDVPQGRQTRQ